VRRILVGYDGSDGSKRALERAIPEAHDAHGASPS
jgi:nucleotide-binding universal stress UspA family protein